MRKGRFFLRLFALLWVNALVGCSHGQQYSLIGKWNMVADNGFGANTLDFTKDARFRQETMTQDAGPVIIEGTYALEGDILTLTPRKVTAINPQFQAQAQAVGMQNSKVHLQWEHFAMVRFLVNGTRAAELHKLQ